MSTHATSAVSGLISNFSQEIHELKEQITQAYNSLIKPKPLEKFDEFRPKIERFYEAINELMLKEDLLISQAEKTSQTARIQFNEATKDDKAELKVSLSSLHKRFIEFWSINNIDGKSSKLMLRAAKRKLQQDTQDWDNLKLDWKECKRDIEILIADIENHQVEISEDTTQKINDLEGRIHGIKEDYLLDLGSFPKEPIVELIGDLDQSVLSGSLPVHLDRSMLERNLNMLHISLQNLLDFYIYIYSPEPKGGHEWGKNHRLDNLDILRQALGSAIFEHVKNYRGNKEEQRKLFFKFYSFSKKVVISRHITETEKKSMVGYALENGAKDPFNLCKAFWARTRKSIFHEQFYSQLPHARDLVRGFTVKGPFFSNRSILEESRDKLSVVCKISDVDISVKKKFILGLLEALEPADRYKIEEHVYHLSNDPLKGGEFWGRDHAYDDLKVLLAAMDEHLKSKNPSQAALKS